MKYLVKNNKIHIYPVPSKCKVEYSGEKLYDEPPSGYKKCDVLLYTDN